MRFYFITITLFSLTLNLAAQPADTVELSSRQIAQIQDQGAAGIQAVIEESNIDLQDKAATHALVSQIVSSQISEASTPESIAEITSQITIAVAEIALSAADLLPKPSMIKCPPFRPSFAYILAKSAED